MKNFLTVMAVCSAVLFVGQVRGQQAPLPESQPGVQVDEQPIPDVPARCHVRTLRCSNFALHTDLSETDARQVLSRMKGAVAVAEKYWRRPHRGQVECYVAHAPQDWPEKLWPHPLARIWIERIGGSTIVLPLETSHCKPKAVLYASTRRFAAEHEAVHAYCSQNFSSREPEWYKEGMAQVLSRLGNPAVQCSVEELRILKDSPPLTMREIVSGTAITSGLSGSLATMLNGQRNAAAQVPDSAWTSHAVTELSAIRKSYTWAWAACHFMTHNPNYSRQFRTLGLSYMSAGPSSFDSMFAAVGPQLEFEWRLFLRHACPEYRVDLNAWDWKSRFTSPKNEQVVRCRVLRSRGFQATRMKVSDGKRYWLRVLNDDATDVMPAFHAIVLKDFRLSESLLVNGSGEFVAPQSGKLFIRCGKANSSGHNAEDLRVVLGRATRR